MTKSKHFRMPAISNINSRSSSITNAFVNAVIPVIHPTEVEVEKALSILGMTTDNIRCSYCGDTATEWDHLKPLVVQQKPTGYISEIANLVPSCGKCNQSKGNKNWREWMNSSAPRSPKSRLSEGIQERMTRLDTYEQHWIPIKLDLLKIVGEEIWNQHEQNRQDIIALMRKSHDLAETIRAKINDTHRNLPTAMHNPGPYPSSEIDLNSSGTQMNNTTN